MKKILLFGSALFIGAALSAQTTATNFMATDCASASHTLFSELDAGKVIVITWVMPCGSCIAGASNAMTAAQSFSASKPGLVKNYVVDDAGNTSCSTLTGWESTNGITTSATFGNAGNTIKMTDYGTSGMPKTVVLGGSSHTVYYNTNGAGSSSAIQTAINNAFGAMTGIVEQSNQISSINVFPNPANGLSSASYSLESASNVNIDIYNLVGAKVKNVFSGNQNSGEQKINIDCSELNSGIYFVKLSTGKNEKTITLSVSH